MYTMAVKSSLVVACVVAFIRSSVQYEYDGGYCYADDENPYDLFGSKTAYDNVRSAEIWSPPDCQAKYVWALIRHGTRYPTSSDELTWKAMTNIRDQLVDNHELYQRGKLCSRDLNAFKQWTYPWDEKNFGELAARGVVDMQGLAQRLKVKFSNLLNAATKDEFAIETTRKNRCQQSAIAFTNKLFGTSFTDLKGNNIRIAANLMPAKSNKKSFIDDYSKFNSSSAFHNMLHELHVRLGYESTGPFQWVTRSHLSKLYAQCVFEAAVMATSKSAFCSAFTKEHLKIMEYLKDVSSYYALGYGNSKNAEHSCPLAWDLFKKMESASIGREESQIGAFYFGHSHNLLPFLARLGLYHDAEPLTYENYAEDATSRREWRTSLRDPFAANVFAVMYNCSSELKVSFYSNEHVVKFPGCADYACPWKTVNETFSSVILQECPFKSGTLGLEPFNVQTLLLICIFVGIFNKFVARMILQ